MPKIFRSYRALALVLFLVSLRCGAGTTVEPLWLTIIGNPLDANAETVQVDVTSAVAVGKTRLVNVRANRSHERMARDGLKFRSYESSVQIDCAKGTARHLAQVLYAGPLWGGAKRSVRYDESDVRYMAFRDMPVNPKDRIIKAACSIGTVARSK